MRHLVRVSVVVLPAAALATALAAGCTSAPGHPAAQAPSSSSAAQPASSAAGPPLALRPRRPAPTLGQRPPCAPITEPSITTTTPAPGTLAAGSPVPATPRLPPVPGHRARQSLHSVGNRERGDGPPCGPANGRVSPYLPGHILGHSRRRHPVRRRAVPSAAPPPPPPSSAAPAAGCHPLTPSGHCYEPGEYCPTADTTGSHRRGR